MSKHHAHSRARWLVLVAAVLPPSTQLVAQDERDSVLLSVPVDANLSCQSLPLTRTFGNILAFEFRVGKARVLLKDPAGTIIPVGRVPRQISIAFDSAGKPQFFTDQVVIDNWHQTLALVTFDSLGQASGYIQDVAVDSAAVMAVTSRDGLQAGLAAASRVLERTPRGKLSVGLMERAKALASALWNKRCF